MSRTLVRPAPEVARTLGAGLFLAIALLHFVSLPEGFETEGYVGVSMVLAFLMAMAGALALTVEDRNRTWWYAVAEGLLNAVGWMATRLAGLPAAADQNVAGQWSREVGLALVFCGVCLAGLGCWVLRVAQLDAGTPVVAARDRLLRRR